MTLNCLIVDDEPLARTGIEGHIKQTSFLALKGSVPDGTEACELLHKEKIDLMFLDINMPQLSGIELLNSLTRKPMTILVTAYSEFAVESYELDVVDYLLKPVSYARFLKAVNKAKDRILLPNPQGESKISQHVFIKTEGRLEKIRLGEILYVEGLSNYVTIATLHKKYITYSSLKRMEELLPQNHFIKIHKSYIVSVDKVTGIEGNQVCLNNIKLPVSKNMKEEVIKKLL